MIVDQYELLLKRFHLRCPALSHFFCIELGQAAPCGWGLVGLIDPIATRGVAMLSASSLLLQKSQSLGTHTWFGLNLPTLYGFLVYSLLNDSGLP
ncbi:hypothetical protein XFF7766_810008 [Xanthomonas citri pv. fuscans]|nr:hypothetical protein XFF7766_810008 [Xanthomonas citri pv. fuscans]